MTKSESNQKKRMSFNQDALDILSQRFGFSINYIQKSLRGDRVGIMPDELKKEYPIIVKELEEKRQATKSTLLNKI